MKKPLLFALAAAVQIIAMLTIAGRYYFVESTGNTVYVPAYGFDPTDLFRGDYALVSYGDLANWTGAVDFDASAGKRVYVTPELSSTGLFVSVKGISDREPEGTRFQAKILSFSYDHPIYGYGSEPASASEALSGSFVRESEWLYEGRRFGESSSDSGVPKTDFATGDSVIAGLSSSGTVMNFYRSAEECVSDIRYGYLAKPYAKELETGTDENATKALSDICNGFPKVTIRSVQVPKTLRLDYGADRFFVEQHTGRAVENDLRKGGVEAVWKVSDSGKIVLHGLKVGDTVLR